MQLPEFIRSFSSLDIPFPEDVVSTNAIRSDEGLAVFFTFHKDADLPPHSHKGQWGTVLEGSITVTMNGETRTYRLGECYSIGSGVVHAVKVPADYDSIVNKTPISFRTNRSIGGSAPSVYLARLRDQGSITDDALDEHLRTHMIDPALLQADDFEQFTEARRAALLDLVADMIGNERVVRSSDASAKAMDQEDFVDDDAIQTDSDETVSVAAE